ncbi:hypothetical protein CYMTET_45194 [Cymbomonas tetramitiformis]|uniref:Uncharacterized protein n=1 Tax=Cymbomonas tetramitiformis TaxID=36881 RepID=A0AAE0EYU8_9CHLO|nr:hypothetical protein CYMTET_45194 [Cymbomonas tetramitiformis]
MAEEAARKKQRKEDNDRSVASMFLRYFSVALSRSRTKNVTSYISSSRSGVYAADVLSRCLNENDVEFREIFERHTQGQYTPPTYKTVMQYVLRLSTEGKERVCRALKALLEEGILRSIAGDIWSQGGISIFGILVYWLDSDFQLHEHLLTAIPFSKVRHTGSELESATKIACVDMGLGEYSDDVDDSVDTVSDHIHATCSDNASNIISGWQCFDGHECGDHTTALIVHALLDEPQVKKVFNKLRGMTTHFSHSVIGAKLLRACQQRFELPESKPPKDNGTRSGWGGAYHQAHWFFVNQVAVQMYDVENPAKAATAVASPDGSIYKNHQLLIEEWDIVREAMYILHYAKIAMDLLQTTQTVTANLFLPVAGKLAHIAHADTPIKFETKPVSISNEHVKKAREIMYKECCSRFFNTFMDCKLEDFAVATFLDPQRKSFKFKYVNRWKRGEPLHMRMCGCFLLSQHL